MKGCSRFLVLPMALAALNIVNFAPGQTRPALDLPTLDSSGVVALRVRGERGTNYAIETSAELTSWWKVFSGVAADGQVLFNYMPAPGSATRYFRARVDALLPPLNVTVQPDTNYLDVTIITPEDGGVLSLKDKQGVTYTLTVSAKAVTDPLVATMTLVTNLVGQPFSAGPLGSVLLEPAGQFLLAPARLEITFPTNLSLSISQITGFTFDQDGRFLRLTPAFPDTNSIRMPVFSLNGFGCSRATLAEIEQMSQRPVGDPGTNQATLTSVSRRVAIRPEGVYLPTTLDQCYPDKLARAKQVDHDLRLSFDAFNQALTANVIAIVRGTPGLGSNPANWGPERNFYWPGNLDWIYSEFYTRNIDPYLTEAQSNCALTQVLAYRIKALEELAGSYGGSVDAAAGAKLSLCAGFKDCLKEMEDCCRTQGLGGQDTVLDAAVIADQAAEFGCGISQSDLDSVSKDCLPTWSGSITIYREESGAQSLDDGTVSSHESYTQSAAVIYTTDSVGLSGASGGPAFYGINGTLKALGAFNYVEHYTEVDQNCCADCTTVRTVKAAALARGMAQGDFIWRLTNSPPPPVPIPLPNVVTPGNDLTIAAAAVPRIGNEVHTDSGNITDPGTGKDECTSFSPYQIPIHGSMEFANLLAFVTFDAAIQGTLSQYQGHWETNIISSDQKSTNSIQVNWNFKRN